MLIAKDTPVELINMASAIDINKISPQLINQKIYQLEGLVKKFLKLRTTKPACMETDLPIPKEIALLTIKYDLNVAGNLKKIAIPIIRNYIVKNLPLKRAI